MAFLLKAQFDPPESCAEVKLFSLGLATVPANRSLLKLTVSALKHDGQEATATLDVDLAAEHSLPEADFDPETLTEVVTLEVRLHDEAGQETAAGKKLASFGLLGLRFAVKAALSAVRIVLRPRPGGGYWRSEMPWVEIVLCWTIDAGTDGSVPIRLPDGMAQFEGNAVAEVCAGLSAIVPDLEIVGLPGVQWRIDLPSFGMGTGWLPLAWIEGGLDLSPLRMDGLLRWFGELSNLWPGLGSPSIDWPTWSLEIPVRLELPFGVRARENGVRIAAAGDAFTIDAWARKLVLDWGDNSFDLPGSLTLRYDTASGRYRFMAALYEKQYPAPGAFNGTPWQFKLPMDLLEVRADCWYLRFGLYGSAPIGDTIERLCFEVLLEVGGMELRSSLSRSADGSGLYRSDLRLLVRDGQVLSNEFGHKNARLFSEVGHGDEPFSRYVDAELLALSFASDLLAKPKTHAPANDAGLTFLAGDFRFGERVYVLWEQKGLRFLRALGHTLLGREPAGKASADEATTLFALEFARFDNGAVSQLRLDWRPDLPAPAMPSGTLAPPSFAADDCLRFDDPQQPREPWFNLPLASDGVYLDVAPADARVLTFAGISLEVARPREQSLVLRREADGETSVSHLLLLPPPPSAAAGAVEPLARARIDFSLKDRQDASERREVSETDAPDGALFTAVLGYAGTRMTAVRSFGWRQGHSPRFLQTLSDDAPPLRSLLPDVKPAAGTGDPGCPPTRVFDAAMPLTFDAFHTPKLATQAWRVSVRFALDALFKAFPKGSGSGQSLKLSIVEVCPETGGSAALIRTKLNFKIGDQFNAEGRVTFRFDLGDLALSVVDGAELDFALPRVETPSWATEVALPENAERYWYSDEVELFGLELTALVLHEENATPEPVQLGALALDISDGLFTLRLPEGRNLMLRYTGLGRDSLNFWVTRFVVGPGGLDLDADLIGSSVHVRGLTRPFALERAALRMRASRLEYLSIDASGRLPELLNEAPVKLTIAFAQQAAGRAIELDQMHCELGDKDSPIFSRGTRFKFEVEQLGIEFVRDAPGAERHFFFELTGSAQFTPDPGEFDGGLLEDLERARIEFVRAPISDEFYKHLNLVVELKKPVTFEVFKLFRMEIRSIGFEPRFDGFAEPGPAVVIGGQCEFAKQGDVISADIKFHAMRIGLPKRGSVLPQWHFDGLRVEISTEAATIGGRVDTYDTDLRKGFAGEGLVHIRGYPQLAAAFAFVRVRSRPDQPWQHAWFIAIEASKISYQLGALPIYLRQIGLGFGYRYTLPLVAEFDQSHKTLRELLEALLRAVDNHHSLASIDSWTPQPDGDARWTIALEGVFTVGTAQPQGYSGYSSKKELKVTTLIAQMFAAFRSDFTVAAGVKVWLPVSVDHFFENRENMRARPLASGFMLYSVPQSRFLAHAAKGKNPYLGPKDDPVPEMVKDVLARAHFEATMLIEPGLLHAELGWPDRLMFDWQLGGLKLACRGGLLLRHERDLLIQGLFFSARGSLQLAGSLDGGFIGVRVEALVDVQFAARLMVGLYLSRLQASNVYAAIGLDIAVRFSVSAWLRLKIGFVRISINISLSFSVQLVVALELGWAGYGNLGFKARAQLRIGVFGRSLSVSVAVGVNESGVDRARANLAQYMGSLLGPGQIPALPGLGSATGGAALQAPAVLEALVGNAGGASAKSVAAAASASADAPVIDERPVPDSFVTAHADGLSTSDESLWFVWIMPGPNGKDFYPATKAGADGSMHYADLDFTGVDLTDLKVYGWHDGSWQPLDDGKLYSKPLSQFAMSCETGADAGGIALQTLLAGCWVPVHEKDFDKGPNADSLQPFPEYWPPADDVPLQVPPPLAVPAEKSLEDERVLDAQHPSRAPNRRLDASHPYDRALMESMKRRDTAAREPAQAGRREELIEQARGNQSFLIQTFHDDLVAMATSTTIGADGTPATVLSASRPTLLDAGMALCIRGKAKPDWLRTRKANIGYPTIRFQPDGEGANAHALLPVIDFDYLDFEKHPPLISAAPPYFDEEAIGLAWRLDWGIEPPAPAFAEGARKDIEAYLRCCEVVFFDVESGRALQTVTTVPGELESKDADGRVRCLRARYQHSVARAALLPGAPELRVQQLGATITPISQTGRRGVPYTCELLLEPKLTPLPADDAQFTLERVGTGWVGRLKWREPMLPPVGGVAATGGWQLVLRPLRQVPLGGYPDDVVDVTDRGLMSSTGEALIEGDILVALPAASSDNFRRERPDHLDPDPDVDRAQAEWIYTLTFDGAAIAGDLHDHRGQKLVPGSPLHRAALAFFDRRTPFEADGQAWRLFVRASSLASAKPESLRGQGVSGLAQARLWLDIPQPKAGPLRRPLPHFEWPTPLPMPSEQMPLTAVPGAIRVSVPDWPDGDEKNLQLKFVDTPNRGRGVQLLWNARGDKPLAAYAAYDLFEVRLEDRVNADEVDDSGFTPAWRWLRRIEPTDGILAAQSPATMAEVQNWEAQYPAYAQTVGWLGRQGLLPGASPRDWPSWYSWAESELAWPPAAFDGEVPLDLVPNSELATWRDVGREVTRARLHDYLALLIGHLSEQALSEGEGGSPPYEVQVIAGPTSSINNPVEWLKANTEALDPYGWAALHRLGVAICLALRDPVTGLLLEQDELHRRLRQARNDVLSASPGESTDLQTRLLGFDRHLFWDLPLQHLRAYRAQTGSGGPRHDSALAMLQLSLRPIPIEPLTDGVPALSYAIYSLWKDPADGELKGVDAEIRFAVDNPKAGLARETIRLSKDTVNNPGSVASVPLKGFFREGDRIFIRASRQDQQTLRTDLESMQPKPPQDENLAIRPIVLTASGASELAESPFGRFDPAFEFWRARFNPKNENSSYRRFLKSLAEAFAPKAQDERAWQRATDAIASAEREEEGSKLLQLFLLWSARFFRTAPLPSNMEPRTENIAFAQPKSVDPLRFAANGQGRMSYTVPIEEEWAGERSYAVVAVGRYDRLLAAPAAPKRVGPAAKGATAAIEFPRVRRLEAPKLLATRLVESRRGRWFHELILAHGERTLSANITVRRKLDFGEIQRSYRRAFAYPSWLERLRRIAGLFDPVEVGLPQPLARDTVEAVPEDDVRVADESVLALSPQARWDGTRYTDAAEPGYYTQTLRYRATASADVVSESRLVVLASPPGVATQPLGNAPVKIGEPPWEGDRATLHEQWSAQLDPSPVLRWLGPRGHRIEVRWPRFVESLDPSSLATHFAPEVRRYMVDGMPHAPFGMLPDPEVRLLVVDETPGATATVAIIDTKEPTDSDIGGGVLDITPFTLRPQSPEYVVRGSCAHPADWDHGFRVVLDAVPTLPGAVIDVSAASPSPIGVPARLAEVNPVPDPMGDAFEQLLAHDALPLEGPLHQLAALAIRLEFESDRLQVLNPLIGPAWLCRPHLVPTEPGDAQLACTQRDLALALRLIVDIESRRAAALVGWDIDAAEQDEDADLIESATGLLHRLEESNVALLLTYERRLSVDQNRLARWRRVGIELWRRDGDMGGVDRWQLVDGPQASAGWNLLLYRKVADPDDDHDATLIDVWRVLRDGWIDAGRGFDPDRTAGLRALLDQLAGQAHRSVGPNKPFVFVQRGNKPRVPWPEAQVDPA